MSGALVALRFLETRFFFLNYPMEFFVGGLALLFTAIGIWIALQLVKPRTIIVEKEVRISSEFSADEKIAEQFGLSKRELDVLTLLAKGHSNAEIAAALFVSTNTIKTHISNIFGKLDVSRRTQAVEKAKQVGIF
ncbi:MAG: response regulator transcription factor [Flavobacterium sp.]|uniref:response regulator transcription factor n=1 Tax=Flavobacterium sp. TaxID=239 RepID=UPI00120CFE9E|nr:response regulator transcription factor [Flavobacterium sp.]RZJ64223.1 MAG: response regulator transcription factor [Flavobacterium sp.]